MPRFFITEGQYDGNSVAIRGADAHHIARSLRMAVGDGVTVCLGDGNELFAHLTSIHDDECIAEVDSVIPSHAESPKRITLYMAYPKGDKLETVVQKAVELGVHEVVPFESERCVKRPAPEKAEKNIARLCRIAEEAAKQCGRAVIPTVSAPISFRMLLDRVSAGEYSCALFCYEGEGTRSLRDTVENETLGDSIAVIVGSEGGFSPQEAEAICRSGAIAVNLGPRILRCETAPDYILSALSYRFEL